MSMMRGGALALVLLGLTLVLGDAQEVDTNSVTVATNTVAATDSAQPAVIEPVAVASNLPPENAAPSEQPPPAEVKLSQGAAAMVKLAQSGVGEDVMLAYVGTVFSKFNLGSDQIIYLNDLGVSGNVVKAMIQRDGELAAASAAATASLVAPTPPPAPVPNPPMPPDNVDVATAPPPPMDNSDAGTLPPDTGDATTTSDDSDYFYNSLAPYGSWTYVNNFGLCWQPTVYLGNHDWRPYGDRGRWVFSDCGWYWQSDYSWGWAAFHYGRWFDDPHRGWVWAPNRVWGPAWVSWRHSDEYCGWAPLPPAAKFLPGSGFFYGNRSVGPGFEFGLQANQYTYIPTARMSDYAPARYAVPESENIEIQSRTAVVNHFVVENHHVVNHSIDPREVAAASQTQIRQAEIREMPRDTSRSPQPDRLAKRGEGLVIFRPQLPPPAARRTAGSANQPKNPAIQPRSSAPLPNMNFGARTLDGTGRAQPAVTGETYPPGSLVVIGKKNPQPTPTTGLPNMKLTHVDNVNEAPPYQPNAAAVAGGGGSYYAGAGPEPVRPAGFNFNNNFEHTRVTQDGPVQAYSAGVQGQPAYVIPAHYTVNQQIDARAEHNLSEAAARYSGATSITPAATTGQNVERANHEAGAESARVESHSESRPAESGRSETAHAEQAAAAHATSAPAAAASSAASSSSSGSSGSGKR